MSRYNLRFYSFNLEFEKCVYNSLMYNESDQLLPKSIFSIKPNTDQNIL